MLRKGLLAAAISCCLGISAVAADVIVRVAPPRPLVERRSIAPGRGYVWVPGYHRWDGRAHVWVPGQWVLAPRPRARWVPAHWVRKRGGWLLVDGHWR